jgi:hypothetical protein
MNKSAINGAGTAQEYHSPESYQSQIGKATGDFYARLREGIPFVKGGHHLRMEVRKTKEIYDRTPELARKATKRIFKTEDSERTQMTHDNYFSEKDRENFLIVDTDTNVDVALGQVKYHIGQEVTELTLINIDNGYNGKTGQALAYARMLHGLDLGTKYTVFKSIIPESVLYILKSGGRTPAFKNRGQYPRNGKQIIESVGLNVNHMWLMDLSNHPFYSKFEDFDRKPIGIPDIDNTISSIPRRNMIVFLKEMESDKNEMEIKLNQFFDQ